MAAKALPSLRDLLSHGGLKTKDFEVVCPRSVRNRIAVKLDDWKLTGHFFDFPPEKITAIDRENDTEDQRKIALLDNWGNREGRNATYLKLAEVLHQRERNDLVDILCTEVVKERETAPPVDSTTNSEAHTGL